MIGWNRYTSDGDGYHIERGARCRRLMTHDSAILNPITIKRRVKKNIFFEHGHKGYFVVGTLCAFF